VVEEGSLEAGIDAVIIKIQCFKTIDDDVNNPEEAGEDDEGANGEDEESDGAAPAPKKQKQSQQTPNKGKGKAKEQSKEQVKKVKQEEKARKEKIHKRADDALEASVKRVKKSKTGSYVKPADPPIVLPKPRSVHKLMELSDGTKYCEYCFATWDEVRGGAKCTE